MPYQSLGEFIEAADAVGEVRYVEGADLDLEVGCLTELAAERNGPMLVFDKFAGYPPGYRVAANAVRSSARRFALAMELPLDLHSLELLRLWRDKRKSSAPIPPLIVEDGPIMECVQQGDAVNVEQFPAPRWHIGDGGRYIGTADMVIIRDPEQGWVKRSSAPKIVPPGSTSLPLCGRSWCVGLASFGMKVVGTPAGRYPLISLAPNCGSIFLLPSGLTGMRSYRRWR